MLLGAVITTGATVEGSIPGVRHACRKGTVYDLISKPNRPDALDAWRLTQRSIDSILKWCRTRDIPLLVVMFPYTVQLLRDQQDAPQWVMEKFAGRRQLPLLDLQPLLFELISREGLTVEDLFMDALHPTILGHQYISRAITERIVREGLLPECR